MAASPANGEVRATGGCLCGAVRFEVRGAMDPVWNCHCGQCRRVHGHYAAYTSIAHEGFVLLEQGGLAWYRSSARARRGFCKRCGSSLFWEPSGEARICVAAGSIDPPTGLSTAGHIYVAHRSDYYRIEDGLPQLPEGGARTC